jgi:hypothetical protein
MTPATSHSPALTRDRRIASARRRISRCATVLLRRERGAEIILGQGGPRKSLKSLKTDVGNPRKTKPFSWELFAQARLDLAKFG